MKFSPLCIDYHADAVSSLDEGVNVVPQIVIDPFSGVVESSESECEEVVQPEKRTVLPPRSKTFKRTLSPLKDDASFACIKQNPLQKNEDEINRYKGESAEISLLPTGDSGSEDDQQTNGGKNSNRPLSPVQDDISFEYVNHDTLQDTDDEMDRHPNQGTDEEMDSHPLHDTDDEVLLDPLQDTDDEIDHAIDQNIVKITSRHDEGKRGKRSLLATRKSVVDVRVVPSYRQSALSQHSKLGGAVSESKRGKRSLLTTRTGEPIKDFEYAINMVEKGTLIASPNSPRKKKRKSEGIQETITDTTDVDEDFNVSLEQVPSATEISSSSSLNANEIDSAVQQDASHLARYERVISRLDPQVLSKIVQGLCDSMFSVRIANVPEQRRAYYYGSTKDARDVFWRGGPINGFAMKSSASFHNCMYGCDGRGRVLRHDQILNLSFPLTTSVLGMLRNGNFRSMSCSAPTRTSPILNSLLPVKPTFTVPPIWVDVVQAILHAKRTSPAIVTPAMTSGTEPLDSHEFSVLQYIESLISNKDVIPMADNGASLNLKRPREEATLPDVSPKRPKESFVEGEPLRKEKRKSRRGDMSSNGKMDRQEKKRRKKEKKKARKERKRKVRAHDAPMTDAVDAGHESCRQENTNQLKNPVHGSGVVVLSLTGDPVDISCGHSDTHIGDGTKRQKIQHLTLRGETATSRIEQWSSKLLATPVVEMSSHYSDVAIPLEAAAFVEQRPITGEGKPEAVLDSKLHAVCDIGGDYAKKRGKREKKAKKTRTRKGNKVLSPSKSSHTLTKREDGSAPEINKQSLPRVPASVRGETDALEEPTRSVRPTTRESFHPPPKNVTHMRTAKRMIGRNQQRNPAEPPNITSVAPRRDIKDVGPMVANSVFVSHDDRSNSMQASEVVPNHQDDRHSGLLENNAPPLRALCSESFLESWNETTALLASGNWTLSCQSLVTDEARAAIDDEPPRPGQRIQLFDTPLLDDAGVDIELPGHAVIVYRLSSWQTSECANVLAKGLARLTALGRYERLDVIFCADIDISPALSLDIAFLQNAVVHQSRTQCHPPSFQVIAPRLLPAIVASSILSSQNAAIASDSFINGSTTDVRVQERARFLLSICPLLTVCGALGSLQMRLPGAPPDDDETRQSFQRLMSNTTMAGNGQLVATNNSAIQQLSLAINVSFD